MNKTTENFFQALKDYVPPEPKKIEFKLTYDKETLRPIGLTIDDTDLPYIILSLDEANTQPHLDPRVEIVDGKLVRHIKKINTDKQPNTKKVFPNYNGNIVTDEFNMLIINSKGSNRWNYE